MNRREVLKELTESGRAACEKNNEANRLGARETNERSVHGSEGHETDLSRGAL